jgi:hypothetical protein
LAAATALSPDLQRVWRRRGHFPARSKSQAVFDPIDVAEISVRYELSKMGVAPTDTAGVGEDTKIVQLKDRLWTLAAMPTFAAKA